MKKHSSIGVLFVLILLLPSCMADMRTAMIKQEGITAENVQRGEEILQKAWKNQGFENLSQHRTYSFIGHDIWRGMMGKMGKPWPEAASNIQFRYAIGTFDSQATFLDGKQKGVKAGLQSWQYYEKQPEASIEFKKYNKRIGFGLSAYHYFFELADRLKQAPIISYAGEKSFNQKKYELVFVTWEKPEPHMAHDQYLLWINQETEMLEYAVYSLRDNFLKMPGSRAFYGSIHFEDFKNIDGILIPHQQTVYLNEPKKKGKKHLHQLRVTNFQFDQFDAAELYPDAAIEKVGDDKKGYTQ